ncbi:hypothetical protein AB0L57_22095 [Nocardia sp. NPDC052254]|uniref:hypothetical protein n=1 Tax=Nocardia sp. NPDC052254 TaxID=3155681 RepID=UPI003414C8CC
MSFPALGYLHADVSLLRRHNDEAQISCLAESLGYTLRKTLVFENRTDDPIQYLIGEVIASDAEAVIVPSLDHFPDGIVPDELIHVTDIITVLPEHAYAWWATHEAPEPTDGA